MKLSIVLPVYNEAKTILEVLKAVQDAPVFGLEKEIIIIDDCSSDSTPDILKKFVSNDVKIVRHEKNQGKGAALKTGFDIATGDIILIQDADLEYDPKEYENLLKPILEDKFDVVYGSRFLEYNENIKKYSPHTLANKFLTFLSNLFSGLKLTDMETCYKVFKAGIIKDIYIEEKRFGFEPEITAKIASKIRKENLRIAEVPISYKPRSYKHGKKIGIKDGIRAIWCIVKYNDSFFITFLRYAFSGLSASFLQFFSMVFLVEFLSFKTVFLQNLANILSILISMVYVFLMHSFFSWRYKFSSLMIFFKKMFVFFVFSGILLIFRILLFYLLSVMGMDYKLNTLINIVFVVIVNFIFYNLVLFKETKTT